MISEEKYVKVVSSITDKARSQSGKNTEISITVNGTYEPEPPFTGFSKVFVDVPNSGQTESLSITPTTSAQTFTPTGLIDGFNPVNVSAVDSSIDSNIQAENIKSGVTILGITGSYSGEKYGISMDNILGNVNAQGVLGYPSVSSNVSFNGVKSIAAATNYYSAPLRRKFQGSPSILEVSFPDLEILDSSEVLRDTFYSSSATKALFPKLKTISGQMAMGATFGISSVNEINFQLLETVSGTSGMADAFTDCSNLTSASFPALKTLSGNWAMVRCFANTGLINLYFYALTSNSFSGYTNQFDGIISGVTGCTIHFPSNLDPQSGSTTISSLSGYPNFGGTNTILSFDLPATE